MLGDEAHKEVLLEDYKRHRQLADKAKNRHEFGTAAQHYRKGASLLSEIAKLESSDRLARERRKLAANLTDAAVTLENREPPSSRSPRQGRNNRGGQNRESPPAGPAGGSTEPPGKPQNGGDKKGESGSSTRSDSSNDDEDESAVAALVEEPPDLDFEDVGGMSELKQTLIDTVVDPLERPRLYEEYDLSVVNGVLLYGPPGTGKTYITRALAGKLGYSFIEATPSDLTSSLVGEAAENVAELFDVAREEQPCLIFIDEIDAIAGQRSGGANKTQSERQMVNQLLQELTEIQGEDIVVTAATNLLEEVDDAIKRSGRFDERIEVPPPDAEARVAMLRVHLRSRPVLAEQIDWDEIKAKTEGYSASDMELIATNAARKALQEAREQEEIQHITQEHLRGAIGETESSIDVGAD